MTARTGDQRRVNCVSEEGPAVEFYTLPVGLGIALGLFETGFVVHWAVDALIVSLLWGIGSYVLRVWKYRDYVARCEKAGQEPSPGVFIVLQTLSTSAVVFAVAGIVMGIRWAFFS